VDRLLGLGDQFLEDCAEGAVQGGKRDEDYEQRFAEWSVIRPLLLSAPALLRALQTDRLFLSGLRRANGGTLRSDRSNRDGWAGG
jgi:hypothetical protein